MALIPIKLYILIAFILRLTETYVRFTNLKCQDLDMNFCKTTKCYLKMVNRTTACLNMHVEIYQLPVTNVTLNLSLHRKYNGYRPFLYNHTIDYCQFQRNPKRHPFVNLFYQTLINTSNLNHTCPYNHDVIVRDAVVDDDKLKLIPLPKGDYMLNLKFAVYNEWKADVKVYVSIDLNFEK